MLLSYWEINTMPNFCQNSKGNIEDETHAKISTKWNGGEWNDWNKMTGKKWLQKPQPNLEQ